jgi:hypothetical protein
MTATQRFHDECGYDWRLHSNRVAGRPLPFGCPTDDIELLQADALQGDIEDYADDPLWQRWLDGDR